MTSRNSNQTVAQNSSCLMYRHGIYYHSRRVPEDLKKRRNKDRVIVSLRTRSRDKACRSSKALSDRLECYWESLRLEFFDSRELGLHIRSVVEIDTTVSDFTSDDALELCLSLEGIGRRKTFFEIENRTISYLKEATSTIAITSLALSDASAFRGHLFSQGLSSSSVRRIFFCIKSILNLAIKERGLGYSNVFATQGS